MRRFFSAAAMPLLLLVVVILFYWKLTLTDQYSWMESPDFAYQVLPWLQFQAGEWHAGRIPLWDPYAWAGQSLIGQGQPGAAYPLNWILFLLPLRDGWIRQANLHWYFALIHFTGVLFAYGLCRDLKRSRGASAVGALAFGLGGWIGSTEWPQMLNGAVWAPLVVMFLLRALRAESPLRNAALAGTCLGMAFLSGHHQAPTFIALAAGGIWAYGLVVYRRKLMIPLAAFGAMFLLVGALQTFPTYEYGKLAVRWVGSDHDPVGWKDPVPYKVHAHFGLGPSNLPGILVPTMGRHANPFIGVTIAALALLAAFSRTCERDVRVLIGIGAGGLLFSLSEFTFFHGIIYAAVPVVEKARNASFAIQLFHFACAMLAAYGIDWLLENDSATLRRRVAAFLALFALLLGGIILALFLAGQSKMLEQERVILTPFLALVVAGLILASGTALGRRGAVAGFALVALSEFSIGGSTYGWRHRSTPDMLLQKLAADSDVAAFLLKHPGFPRVEVDMEAVPYTFGEWYGIDTMDAYTASMQANTFALQGNSTARMLLALNFFIGRKPSRSDQIEVMRGRSGLKVYVNPESGPRVWSVHAAEQLSETELSQIWSKGVRALHRTAYLSTPPPKLESCEGDRVRLVERLPNRLAIEAEMACAGLVVAAESYYPGWRARVDGSPAPIVEAYGGLRAVPVPGGKHRIEMVYRPLSVIAGAMCTAVGLVISAALLVAPRLRGGAYRNITHTWWGRLALCG